MGFVIDILTYLADHPVVLVSCVLMYVLFFALSVLFSGPKAGRNPFQRDTSKPPKDPVIDQSLRDRILKQGFAAKKVPEKLDAIVVGSGIGGLGAAAMLAKAGKKVLVLEQHDQAGGCCHTFIEKGFEFDVGIHYIGEMRNNTVGRLMVEQITNGQLVWEDLPDDLDTVALGPPGHQKLFPFVCTGHEGWKRAMLEKFPDEEKALDRFLFLIMEVRKSALGQLMLKTQSRWIGRFLIATGLLHRVTQFFRYSSRTTKDVMEEITENQDLRAVLSYCWGDYGSPPHQSSFAEHAMLISHYIYGASYPRGGASEIAFHIIPVIESAGGRVYVRAPVSQILCRNGRACGVRVSKGSGDIDVFAPLIISDAGVVNTFTSLLPKDVLAKSAFPSFIKKKGVDSGYAAMQLFVGLSGTTEELGLKASNIWAYTSNEANSFMEEYYNKSRDEVTSSCDIPLLFISFPSTKDSTYNTRFPGKSVVTIVTLGNWEWFKDWESERVQNRGPEYEAFKNAIGRKMWDQTLKLYPQLEDKVEYFEVGTPLTNKFYLNSPRGEIYGLDHNTQRFGDPEVVMNLRPDTDIPGLLLTGQDVLSCGFMGALFGSLLCASKALNRNLYNDLLELKKQLKKSK